MPSHYVLSVFLEVVNPTETVAFCCQHLDFTERSRGDGWAEIDNGALALRVVPWPGDGEPPSPVVLELVTEELEATCNNLSQVPGVSPPDAPNKVAHDRIERRIETALGVVLVVTKRLTEDDLDEFPELPSELVWQPEAVSLVQEMLRLVPLSFRDGARRRVTAFAESLAVGTGAVEVVQRQARDALLQATPDFQQDALQAALRERDALEGSKSIQISATGDG
jgi:hypothetical protein